MIWYREARKSACSAGSSGGGVVAAKERLRLVVGFAEVLLM